MGKPLAGTAYGNLDASEGEMEVLDLNPSAFQVLSRHQPIHKSTVLEASAGTGKTFSIEHLVARFLIEGVELEQILVVTFTRAATGELKQRIHQTVERCYHLVTLFLRGEEGRAVEEAEALDFLLAILESERGALEKARLALEHALFCFEKASIFTIHGFCARMLSEVAWESGLGTAVSGEDEDPQHQVLHDLVRDFLRTRLTDRLIGSYQLEELVQDDEKAERWVAALSRLAFSPIPVEKVEDFDELHHQFRQGLVQLVEEYGLTGESFRPLWLEVAESFKEILANKKREETLAKLDRFVSALQQKGCSAELFDHLLEDGPFLRDSLAAKQVYVKKQAVLTSPSYLRLTTALDATVIAPWRKGSAKEHWMAVVGGHAQRFCHDTLPFREYVPPDFILEKMRDALGDPCFQAALQEKFRVAIIDEFQDTDPVQWEIFRRLFVESERCTLYLVGDPKQSIYAFRRADVYTYLRAAQDLAGGRVSRLDTNFRSTPRLVSALNALFLPQRSPLFLPLPRLESSLACPSVHSGAKEAEEIDDGKGAVHFMAARLPKRQSKTWPSADDQEKQIFPSIAREIVRLQDKMGVSFGEQAILVRSHHQGEEIRRFLENQGIPCLARKGESLGRSFAVGAWEELLLAMLNPRSASAIKVALGGRVLGWNEQAIVELEASAGWTEVVEQFLEWKQRWAQEGIGAFWRTLLQSGWQKDSPSIGEMLVGREGGESFYRELQQVLEYLLERERHAVGRPERLLQELVALRELSDGQEVLQVRQDPTLDAVQILTMHVSKGLEFTVVYALGAMVRSAAVKEGELILDRDPVNGEQWLVGEEHPEALNRYLMEQDAEKGRQLYVAMTRAKRRLYLPLAIQEPPEALRQGNASPLDLFMAQFDQPSGVTSSQLYERIGREGLADPLIRFVENEGEAYGLSLEWMDQECPVEPYRPRLAQPTLQRPPEVKVVRDTLPVESFTSLAKAGGELLPVDPPRDYECEEKSPFTLPAGSDTGIFCHALLEEFDFCQSHQAVEWWLSQRNIPALLEPWRPMFSRWFHDLSLSSLGAFNLAQVDPRRMSREWEFVYERPGQGFLRGVIDLFFQVEDKYYLLDWKTNWLGPSHADYAPESLRQAMAQHDYYLQARIYAAALERYLRWVEPRPFSECFGGAFYLFIRGMTPEHPGCGVLALSPGELDV